MTCANLRDSVACHSMQQVIVLGEVARKITGRMSSSDGLVGKARTVVDFAGECPECGSPMLIRLEEPGHRALVRSRHRCQKCGKSMTLEFRRSM